MWTRENRRLYDRKGLRYPSDLSDSEWTLIGPLIPRQRKQTPALRAIFRALGKATQIVATKVFT